MRVVDLQVAINEDYVHDDGVDFCNRIAEAAYNKLDSGFKARLTDLRDCGFSEDVEMAITLEIEGLNDDTTLSEIRELVKQEVANLKEELDVHLAAEYRITTDQFSDESPAVVEILFV